MNIPLVNSNSVDAINTSLIAIKKTVNSKNQIQDVDVNVGINIATNCTYCAASSTTLKGAQLYNGCSIKVLFTNAITGSDITTPMSINYNGVSIPVKTGKNGVLSNFVANNINGTYIYCQAYTTLELLFDGTQFIIMGNPVVISSADYTIYTDGTITNRSISFFRNELQTNNTTVTTINQPAKSFISITFAVWNVNNYATELEIRPSNLTAPYTLKKLTAGNMQQSVTLCYYNDRNKGIMWNLNASYGGSSGNAWFEWSGFIIKNI